MTALVRSSRLHTVCHHWGQSTCCPQLLLQQMLQCLQPLVASVSCSVPRSCGVCCAESVESCHCMRGRCSGNVCLLPCICLHTRNGITVPQHEFGNKNNMTLGCKECSYKCLKIKRSHTKHTKNWLLIFIKHDVKIHSIQSNFLLNEALLEALTISKGKMFKNRLLYGQKYAR